MTSMFKSKGTIQNETLNVQPQRLTLVTSNKDEVIVRTLWKHREASRNDLLAA